MITPSPDSQKILEALTKAVEKALERKRRLGHYAVIWRDGKPVCIGEDAPPSDSQEQDEQIADNAATKPTPSNRA